MLTPAGAAVGVTLLFIAISVWWASVDQGFPNGDNGKHLSFAFSDWDYLKNGDLLGPFKVWRQYPPLVHMVGAIGAGLTGPSIETSLILENLVFVPLLALGCYGTARITFGRSVAPLAVVFALGAPMVISLFHVFMLDAPEAAMVAVSVWLLLLSERWKRRWISVLAAVAVAMGLYTKPTFIFFVAGVIVVMLLRGGWREWPGFLIFSAITLVLVEPWYFYHWNDILGLSSGFTSTRKVFWYGAVPYPQPFTLKSLAWYGWATVNQQLLLPLTVLFVGGAIAALVRLARHGARNSYVPELLAGGLAGWILISGINLDDPRYSLPALVYMAVLGTWWIGRLPLVARATAIGLLVLIFAFNTLQVNEEVGPTVVIHTSASVKSPIEEWTFVVARPGGYLTGHPSANGAAILALLRATRAAGHDRAVFQPESLNVGGFNLNGLIVLAQVAGLLTPGFTPDLVGPHGAYFVRDRIAVVGRPPCVDVGGGYGIYLIPGPLSAKQPPQCPPGFAPRHI